MRGKKGNLLFSLVSLFFLFPALLKAIDSQDVMLSEKLAVRYVHRKLPLMERKLQKAISTEFMGKVQTLLNEDFESSNIDSLWVIPAPATSIYSPLHWGKVAENYHLTGVHSVWCAARGGNLIPMVNNYKDNMATIMIFGPVSFADNNWAKLRFSFWLESELYHDFLHYMVSIDGENFYGNALSGSTEGKWLRHSVDLSNIRGLGDVTGASQVWVAFEFVSNESITFKGAFLDDIWLDAAQTETLPVENIFSFPGMQGSGATWDGENLWFSDMDQQKIFKTDGILNVLKEYNSPLASPADLAWDGRRLWIAETSGSLINLQIIPSPMLNSSGQFPIKQPYGLTFWDEHLYISDLKNNTALYTFNGNVFDSMGVDVMASSRFTGLASEMNAIWIADSANSFLYKFINENDSLICIGTYKVPGTPFGLAHDERNLYYLSGDSIYQIIPPRINVQINEIKAISFPEIFLYASVTDDKSQPINNLTSDNFSVYEDDIHHEIEWVIPYAGNSNIAFALVLDYSNSMGEAAIENMERAAKEFIALKQDQDLGAIYKFRSEVWFAQNLTTNDSLLYHAINSDYPYRVGKTALYDAIDTAAIGLANINFRRAIIAITDGQDNASTLSLKEMIQHVKNLGIPVFMIGLGDSIKEDILRNIAQQTNGDYYFAPQSDTLDDIYTNIAQRISNQYEIKYTTTNSTADSTVRFVKLVANYDNKSGYGQNQYIPPGFVPPFQPVLVWIDDFDVIAGDSFRIPVNMLIEEYLADPISALFLSIVYDSSMLFLDSIKIDSSNFLNDPPIYAINGQNVVISIASSTDFPQGYTLRLFDLIGTVIGSPGGITTLTIDSLLVNEGYPPAGSKDGIVRIRNQFDISGTIGYYSGFNSRFISGVNMSLKGLSSYSTVTNESGYYSFNDIPSMNLMLVPSIEIGRTAAVSAFDAAMILKYVVGSDTSLTEFQKLAGDVTHNYVLSALDAAEIQKYVVGIGTDSLKIGKFFFFPKDSLPFQLSNCRVPHSIKYSPLNSDHEQQNFLGYILGDVTGNWKPNFSDSNIPKNLTASIILSNILVDSNNIYIQLSLNSKDQKIYSLQGNILYLPALFRFKGVELNDKMSELNLLYNDKNETVAFSLISANEINEKDFLLRFIFDKRNTKGIDNQTTFKISDLMINDTKIPDIDLIYKLKVHNLLTPEKFKLGAAFPNPFNSKIMIKYEIPKPAKVELSIFNIRGQKVKTLINEKQEPGFYQVFWDGTDQLKHSLPTGVYILNLRSDGFFFSKKLLLIR